MFDITPKSFNKYIVECSTPPIHTYSNPLAFQHPGEGVTGELRALRCWRSRGCHECAGRLSNNQHRI